MTGRPVWSWLLLDAAGRELPAQVHEAPEAGSRFDAELWLGEHWRALAAAGVTGARLLRDGDVVSVVELLGLDW